MRQYVTWLSGLLFLLLPTLCFGSPAFLAHIDDPVLRITTDKFDDLTAVRIEYDNAKKQNNTYEVIKTLRKSAQIYINRENYFLAEKRLEESIGLINKTGVLKEDMPHINYSMALICHRLDRHEECIVYADKAIKGTSYGRPHSHAYSLKAQALYFLHRNAEFEQIAFKMNSDRNIGKYVDLTTVQVMHFILRRDFRNAHSVCNTMTDEAVRLEMMARLYEAEGLHQKAKETLLELDRFNEAHMAKIHKRDHDDIDRASGIQQKELVLELLSVNKAKLDVENKRLAKEKGELELEASKEKAQSARLQLENDSIDKLRRKAQYAEATTRINTQRETDASKRHHRELQAVGITAVIVLLVIVMLTCWGYNLRIRRKNRKLENARRMVEESDRVKTEFLQNISHEIRTPLNAMLGFAQILNMKDLPMEPEEKLEYAMHIKDNANDLAKLIEDIYTLSRLDNGQMQPQPQPTNINSLCKATFEEHTRKCEPGVKTVFTTDLSDGYSQPIDKEFLTQILGNLISNAKKYTKQGCIAMRISDKETVDRLTLSVEDTGPGIPKDKAESIFNRFEKIGSFVQGNGLGLSISKELTRLLGGSIFLDTNCTLGTRMVLTIPK